MLVALIIIGSIAVYAMIGGFIGGRFHLWRTESCRRCSGGSSYGCLSDHTTAALFAGALWPLLAPVVAGFLRGTSAKRKADDMEAKIKRLERELGMLR